MSKETPTLSKDAMIAFLSEHPEMLAKGADVQTLVNEAFAGQFVVKMRERLENKKSETTDEAELEEFVNATISYVDLLKRVVKMTDGTPNGNAQTKYDRWQIELPTAQGTFKVRLDKDL